MLMRFSPNSKYLGDGFWAINDNPGHRLGCGPPGKEFKILKGHARHRLPKLCWEPDGITPVGDLFGE